MPLWMKLLAESDFSRTRKKFSVHYFILLYILKSPLSELQADLIGHKLSPRLSLLFWVNLSMF